MLKRLSLNHILLFTVFVLFVSSCVNWDDKGGTSVIRTDVRIHIFVKNMNDNSSIANETINWSFHLYNGSTSTESDQKTGTVTSNNTGEADIPVYECQLNAGKIVRFMAYYTGQDNASIVPITISYDDALSGANENDFAVITRNYIVKK